MISPRRRKFNDEQGEILTMIEAVIFDVDETPPNTVEMHIEAAAKTANE